MLRRKIGMLTFLLAILLVQNAAAQPALARVHLQRGVATPPASVGKASDTPGVQFDKAGNEHFMVTWDNGNPCTRNGIGDTQPVCLFKPHVCRVGQSSDHKCHFTYHIGTNDPEIIIDEGDNGPPPQALVKQAKAAAKAGRNRRKMNKK